MLRLILNRIAIAIPTLLVLIVLTYLLMYAAPGGPFTRDRPLAPEIMANLNAKYGLDQPLYKQILTYVINVTTQFDFGPSFTYKDRTVNEIIASGFPITLKYGLISFVVTMSVGITLGVMAAVRQNTWLDYFAVGISIGAQVLPNFVLAPILVLIFTVWLGWLPGGGWEGGDIWHLIMPVIALSTSFMASVARLSRSSMLEVLNSDHVRTARAKGLPERIIILRHALRPAMLPVISYSSQLIVFLMTGSVVIDMFFSTGGIGLFFVNAAFNRDYPTMMGITILTGALTIIFNLVADMLYAWIDPKIRY